MVDPKRDSVKKMGLFSRFFNPELIGLSGDMQTIDRVASDYDIIYWYTEEDDPDHYIVNHTAVVIVIDRQGNERLIWDLRKLARETG
jgi:protein SCO1/2